MEDDQRPTENQKRRKRADQAMVAYSRILSGSMQQAQWYEDDVVDLLSDLYHLVEFKGLSMEALFELAQSNFEAEIRSDG